MVHMSLSRALPSYPANIHSLLLYTAAPWAARATGRLKFNRVTNIVTKRARVTAFSCIGPDVIYKLIFTYFMQKRPWSLKFPDNSYIELYKWWHDTARSVAWMGSVQRYVERLHLFRGKHLTLDEHGRWLYRWINLKRTFSNCNSVTSAFADPRHEWRSIKCPITLHYITCRE